MKWLSFKEFVDKYGLKREATSNVKLKEILGILKLNSTGIYMRDDQITTISGIVNLHPTKGTHWHMFAQNASGINEFYFDSYGCPPPLNITKQSKKGFFSEYQNQKNDSYWQRIVYVLYLTQSIGFKNAVLNLYYQT